MLWVEFMRAEQDTSKRWAMVEKMEGLAAGMRHGERLISFELKRDYGHVHLRPSI